MKNIIPEYKIKYKNESIFMKILAILLFFAPSFMTGYATTIGNNIYLVSREKFLNSKFSAKANLIHEMVHVKDAKKYTSLIFSFLYAIPQIFALPLLVLFFFLKWWMVLPIIILFLLPLPAFFRMKLEKKAYSIQLYTLYKLATKYNYDVNFDYYLNYFTNQFKISTYYYMWTFFDKNYFNNLMDHFELGEKPFYDQEYYDMADQLIEKFENINKNDVIS